MLLDNRLTMAKTTIRLFLLSFVVSLSSCNLSNIQFPGVYKMDIPQGNIITQEMIDQLRPGMTKRQVVFVMGTPLVRDPFRQDRWDYIWSYQPGGGIRGQEGLTVYFVDDILSSFTGDFTPSEDAISAEATDALPPNSALPPTSTNP